MTSLARLFEHNLRALNSGRSAVYYHVRLQSTQQDTDSSEQNVDDEEFRVLNLRNIRETEVKKRVMKKNPVQPPRTMKMPTDQDWTAVWPAPRSFHPASVPLPLRQGYTEKNAPAPSKYANAELMKIPNFLHLSPPAIAKQCEAIKKFCTPWPKGLESEEKWSHHFPLNIISTDYCHALPTIRNPEARRITMSLKLSNLKFDVHAKDKFLRLVGERYNSDTDMLTIVGDRCPLRKQNYDYALYLLTACYHESFVTEPWEDTKTEADMEYYHFERNKSKKSVEAILNWGKSISETKIVASPGFGKSVEQLINEGENEYTLTSYKNEVLQMLNLAAK